MASKLHAAPHSAADKSVKYQTEMKTLILYGSVEMFGAELWSDPMAT